MTSSRFKFLRRVRIHGGECGAVARALHHEAQKSASSQVELLLISDECSSLRQAEPRKAFGSTFIERKQMSTKTSIKRLALVAVSALGFGLLSVIPANAAVSAVSAGTPGIARVGVASNTTITMTQSAAVTAQAITAQITSAPATSTKATLVFSAGSGTNPVTGGDFSDSATDTAANMGILGAAGIARATFNTAAGDTASIRVALTPDVAGTYTVLVSYGGTATAGFQNGNLTASFSVTTRGTPTSISINSVGRVVEGAPDNYGANLQVTLRDADGNTTILGQSEAINVTSSTATAVTRNCAAGARTFLENPVSGIYTVCVEDGTGITADGTAIITFTGAGALPATLTTNTSVSVINAGANTAQVSITTATNYAGTSPTLYTAARSSHSYTLARAVDADTTVGILVTPAGLGARPYATSVVVPAADDTVAFSVTQALNLSTLGINQLTVGTSDGAGAPVATPIVINYEAPVANKITAVGQTSIVLPTGGSVPLTVTITDQFGNAVANTAVTVAATGRTTVPATSLGVTNSRGQISYTFTDSGTTGTSNTVTFSATLTAGPASGVAITSGSAASFTITYGTVNIGTVTVTGGNTTAGVTATTPVLRDINAGATGVQATTYPFSATVRDANGNLALGVPVTWTISGNGAAVLSTTASTFTNGSGVASASVYGWIAGTYTVTATAGGKTGTGTITFAQTAAGEERTLSAVASGPVVTATVVDRFGNPVPGVRIWATETGAGYFGSGTTRTDSTTDANGKADFIIAGGDAEVTLYTYNPATAGAVGSGQTCARAAAADCGATAADDTAFTATVAGTALVAETGVGASFAPAGVSTVKVNVTGVNAAAIAAEAASDAALEAIDAANAATDAANLAAEAADAATVAAEEARDAADAATAAVEALASEVATLIASLKAQITTLANTVAKIAKRVRA